MIPVDEKNGQEMGRRLGREDMDAMIEEAMEEEAKGKSGEGESLPGDDM